MNAKLPTPVEHKAIETTYAGCHFRSRLEARWAVFFDHLNVEWEYEPEGFEHHGYSERPAWRYLPDFHLPALGVWVEVKGDLSTVDDDYLVMIGHTGHFLPGLHNAAFQNRGLLLLGSIPRPRDGFRIRHTMISHYKGAVHQRAHWDGIQLWAAESPISLPLAGRGLYRTSQFDEGDLPHSHNRYDLWEPTFEPNEFWAPNGVVDAAYNAARSARFEFGQSGAQ